MKNNPETANGKKEKIMPIELYNNFVRFLAKLAEYAVSLLKTLKNNLSDLVVTFARSAFQRNSAVIKVFLVGVVVALGGTWQDLEILGPGLSEAVGKFALAPFIIKLRDKLSKKAIDDPEILGDLNRINEFGKRMESASTADQEEIFGKIKDAVSSINKRLKEIGEETIRIFGRVTDEDKMYHFGRSPDSRRWFTSKEKAFEADRSKIKDEDRYKLVESPLTNPGQDVLKASEDPAEKAIAQNYFNMGETRSAILQGRSEYLIGKPGGKWADRKARPYVLEALKGLSKDEKIVKLYDLRKELLENPRAFQIKYGVKSKVEWPEKSYYGGSKKIGTKTTQLESSNVDTGGYMLETDLPKRRVIIRPENRESAAKRKKEANEWREKYKVGLEQGILTRDEYNSKIASIAKRESEEPWVQDLISQGFDVPKGAKSPYEALSHPDNIKNIKGRTALEIGDEITLFQPKAGSISKTETIRSVDKGPVHYMHQRFEDTYIVPDEDGSLVADFTGSIFKNVDGMKVKDWSKVKFGDIESGSVAVLDGLKLSEQGAKSFKKHHNDKIGLLSEETREKYKGIFWPLSFARISRW